MLANEDRRPDRDAATNLLVPSALLAHELGTPINVLQGYARLLASGAFGPLDHGTSDAVEAMRAAAARLARSLALLTPNRPPPPPPNAPSVDLVPALTAAWQAIGLSRIGGDDFRLAGDAWSGWADVLDAMLAAVVTRTTETVTVTAADGELALSAAPSGGGSGDEALAGWVAQTRADDAGLQVEWRDDSRLLLVGRLLQRGSGRLLLAAVASSSAP